MGAAEPRAARHIARRRARFAVVAASGRVSDRVGHAARSRLAARPAAAAETTAPLPSGRGGGGGRDGGGRRGRHRGDHDIAPTADRDAAKRCSPFSHLVQHNTTATTDRDKVAPTRVVAALDDVKNFVGIQNLVAHEPMLQPQTPNGSINPAECWPAVGGGVPSAYDLGTVIGFYGLTIDEPPTGTAPNQVGQLIVAFRDAATAQRHLADLASIWRRCGGRTVTLFRSEWRRPVELSTSVPEVVDGITTMVLTAQGPVLRVREDHAIAAKNNVLVDVDIMTPDTSRGQQAVIGITNYILAKIPG